MAAALLFKEFGFVLTLRSVDCCVLGASRWAVKEGRLGRVGALGELLGCASFALSLGPCGPRDSSTVMEFGRGNGVQGRS